MVHSNKQVRGYKPHLAEAAGCHSSYLSQVLKGPVGLTLEQALKLASFWKLCQKENGVVLVIDLSQI